MRYSLSVLAMAVTCALAATKEEWKTRNIYVAMTDRIARGEDDTGGGLCGELSQYCGGTFKGLQSKLGYIQGAGFDAIWISPVVSNTDAGYHGYWANDLYSINEKFGSAEDLKDLVSEAHDKGMFVMIDVVANHMGHGDKRNFKPEPLNRESSYHEWCEIDYAVQKTVEGCSLGYLPDLKTTDTAVREALNTWIKWLVEEYSFDGVRIDTVKHIEKDFWPDFSEAAGVYAIGEVAGGNVRYLAGYDGLMDGYFDYPTFFPMKNFYLGKGTAQKLVDTIDEVSTLFADPAAMGSFLDNHDNHRWMNETSDPALFKNALAFVVLSRGIPFIYYGTEQAYAGGENPFNREPLWSSDFNTDADAYKFLAALNTVRTDAGGLGGNDHEHLHIAKNAYAWSRAGGDLIVLTTNGGEDTSAEYCFASKVNDAAWDIVLGGEGSVTSNASGELCLTVNYGLPVVVKAKAQEPAEPPAAGDAVNEEPAADESNEPATDEAVNIAPKRPAHGHGRRPKFGPGAGHPFRNGRPC